MYLTFLLEPLEWYYQIHIEKSQEKNYLTQKVHVIYQLSDKIFMITFHKKILVFHLHSDSTKGKTQYDT